MPRILTLVLLVVVCVYTNEGFINVVLPPFLEQQGVPLAQLGGIIAAMNLAALLSRLPAGLLYRPERASLYAGLALAAVAGATFAYPRTDSEAVLGALRLVHGFAFGVATTRTWRSSSTLARAASNRGGRWACSRRRWLLAS
jgi:hypothetical protein